MCQYGPLIATVATGEMQNEPKAMREMPDISAIDSQSDSRWRSPISIATGRRFFLEGDFCWSLKLEAGAGTGVE